MSGINEQFLGLRPRAAAGGSGAASTIVRLGAYTISNDTSVDIHSGAAEIDAAIDDTYREYILRCIDIVPASDTTKLQLLVTTDTGSSFETSNYNASDGGAVASVPISDGASANGNLGTGTGETFTAMVRIANPAGALATVITKEAGSYSQVPAGYYIGGATAYTPVTVVNGFRILLNSGNIVSGLITLDGVI